MDINLTGIFWGMPFNLTGTAYQPLIYIILGGIAGALISGLIGIIRDWLNGRRDRKDKKNGLIGQLRGQKHFVLQLYAFYFFSFITREYLIYRSTIEGIHGIDYARLEEHPIELRSEEAMRMANRARLESIEYKSFLKEEDALEEKKLKLARGIRDLFTVIGSLQGYYLGDIKFDILVKEIETAIDDYNRLELDVISKFNKMNQDALQTAGRMLVPFHKKFTRFSISFILLSS